MGSYVPELGQALFGQPTQEYGCPGYIYSHLSTIRDELDRVMWNIHQVEYDSPFGNTGNKYKNDVFEVCAYSWDDDVEQPYNFKYKDIEISWYKYLGRGMSMNRSVDPVEAADMLNDCIESLLLEDKSHDT